MNTIGEILFFATLLSGFEERIVAEIPEIKGKIMQWIALALGVILALAFRLDALAPLGYTSPFSVYVDYVLTGLVMGLGGSVLHDVVGQVAPGKKPL